MRQVTLVLACWSITGFSRRLQAPAALFWPLRPAGAFHTSLQGAPFAAVSCAKRVRSRCRWGHFSPTMQRVHPQVKELNRTVCADVDVLKIAEELQQQYLECKLNDEEEMQLRLWVYWNRTKGPDFEGTCKAKEAVAVIMRERGKLDSATGLLREVWLSYNSTKGPHHLGTLNSELAYQQVRLQRMKQKYGRDHNSTLTLQSEVANKLFNLRKWQENNLASALTLQKEVFETRNKTLGWNNSHTVNSASRLAEFQRVDGDLDEAMRLQQQVYLSRNRTLGMEHPDTLGSKLDLAMVHQTKRDLQAAEKLQREVMESVKKMRFDDPLVPRAHQALAGTLMQRGDVEGAEVEVRAALDSRNDELGPDHEDTLKSKLILANILRERRRLVDAAKLQVEVWQARSRTLGRDNSETLRVLRDLATTKFDLDDVQQAIRYTKQVWKAESGTPGNAQPDTVTSMRDLARTLEAWGYRQDAKDLRGEVLRLETKSRNSTTLPPKSSVAVDQVALLGRLSVAQESEQDVQKVQGKQECDPKNHTFRPWRIVRRVFASIRAKQRANAESQKEEKIRSAKSRIQGVLQARWYTSDDWFRVLLETPWDKVTNRVKKYVIGFSCWAACVWGVQACFRFPTAYLVPYFQFLSFVVSSLIVFRLHKSYDRFWEGRKMWQLVQKYCTSLAQKIVFYRGAVPKDVFDRVKILLCVFPSLLSEHLGGLGNPNYEYAQLLTRQDLDYITQESINAPLYIANQLGEEIRRIPLAKETPNSFTNSERRDLNAKVEELTGCIWDGEKLVQTPVPGMIVELLTRVLTVWLGGLTLAFVEGLGRMIVPSMAIGSYFVFGIMEAGLLLEQPFKRAGELPLQTYIKKIHFTITETMKMPKSGDGQDHAHEENKMRDSPRV